MPLKESFGNMYPWVTHMHCHIGGECGHKCTYCYVDNPRWGRPDRYSGSIRLIEHEFKVRYGEGKTIFIEHKNDICGPGVTSEMVAKIIAHCSAWPKNTYVFQTKNPEGLSGFIDMVPANSVVGVTIETNRYMGDVSNAPHPERRYEFMRDLKWNRKFVTIEPVMDFDVDVLSDWIADINPEFLNLGADSKNHNLSEPSMTKIDMLVDALAGKGVELREKHNLNRLRNRR